MKNLKKRYKAWKKRRDARQVRKLTKTVKALRAQLAAEKKTYAEAIKLIQARETVAWARHDELRESFSEFCDTLYRKHSIIG